MNKRYQVFISSTYLDLKQERQAVVQAILEAKHIPAGMELFSAGNKSQWEVIKKWIDESDVYVLILGGRYGSVDPVTNKSYTQMEFEYAVEQNKPFFSVVLNDDYLAQKAKVDPTSWTSQENESYKSFRNEVTKYLVSFCENIDDVKLKTTQALYNLIFSNQNALVGWIRADSEEHNSIPGDSLISANRIVFDGPDLLVTYEDAKRDFDSA